MTAFALAVSCAAFAASSDASMTGRTAPDVIVKEWPEGPEVHLRNIRGRKAVVFLYHTDC